MTPAYGSIGRKTSAKRSASFTPKGAWAAAAAPVTEAVYGGGVSILTGPPIITPGNLYSDLLPFTYAAINTAYSDYAALLAG